jgi:hypothetical protein
VTEGSFTVAVVSNSGGVPTIDEGAAAGRHPSLTPAAIPPGADDKVSNVHLAVGLRQWELGTTGSKV